MFYNIRKISAAREPLNFENRYLVFLKLMGNTKGKWIVFWDSIDVFEML